MPPVTATVVVRAFGLALPCSASVPSASVMTPVQVSVDFMKSRAPPVVMHPTQILPARAPDASASGFVNTIWSPGEVRALRRALRVAHVLERGARSSSVNVSVRAPGSWADAVACSPAIAPASRRRRRERDWEGEMRTMVPPSWWCRTLCTLLHRRPGRQGPASPGGRDIPASRPAGTCAPGGPGRARRTLPVQVHRVQEVPMSISSATAVPASADKRPRLALLLALLAIPGSTIAWSLPMGGFWIGLPLAIAAIVRRAPGSRATPTARAGGWSRPPSCSPPPTILFHGLLDRRGVMPCRVRRTRERTVVRHAEPDAAAHRRRRRLGRVSRGADRAARLGRRSDARRRGDGRRRGGRARARPRSPTWC